MALKLIQGGNKPKPYRAKDGGYGQWTCTACEIATGISTSAIVTVTQSPMERAGKIVGGIKTQVCLHCLLRGVVTPV